MAVFHSLQVACPCGQAFSVDAARSVNIRRNPAARTQILEGKFHRVNCPVCGKELVIERPFYYSDPERSAVFLVLPRGERVNHSRDGETITAQKRSCQLINRGRVPKQLRVVYGLDELREKLVAQDAGLDDRHVELLKLFVLQEHPFLMGTPRLQLVLSESTLTQLGFTAYHHNQPRSYSVQISRCLADSFLSQSDDVHQWVDQAGHQAKLFSPQRRWVNFRRWTTRYSALDALKAYATTVRAGGKIDLTSTDFATMCSQLPRAASLSSGAKADLQTLFNYAKQVKNEAAQDKLLEVRYGVTLEDEWATNRNTTDIDTIWNLLRNVPPNNIEGNVHLKEIDLVRGGGGTYQWSGVIQIGSAELAQKERFEDVLRHEVGHAVHADKAAVVDPWLQSEFGWQRFQPKAADIDAWVALMGGWNAWGPVTASQRVEMTNALAQALGNGASWDPGTRPSFPANHPWNRPGFGPRLAVEGSLANWYTTFDGWYRAKGLAFVLNYWYAELLVVKASTLDLIRQMPDNYAAMSHFEFFAELYALYYDADDPDRQRIPKKVATWLDSHIGKPVPAAPAAGKKMPAAGKTPAKRKPAARKARAGR